MHHVFENLTSLINEYNKVVIMSHKNIDLDALDHLCVYITLWNLLIKRVLYIHK